ncbi:Vacuolar protein sorting-associated protein atg6 [Ophidiomyces ophidiicola]|nr:Vacuolar protein sorting-associated protein atg6 [Ophidiomyces ophidiicola]
MYCQSCRIPLVESSLDTLNPASFDILIASTGKIRQPPSTKTVRSPPIPEDRPPNRVTAPLYEREIPQARACDGQIQSPNPKDTGMSFVVLTNSQVLPTQTVLDTNNTLTTQPAQSNLPEHLDLKKRVYGIDQSNPHVEKSRHLFEIISARSDIDQPICMECTELLVSGMQKQLSTATKEQDAYISFLRNVGVSIPSEDETRDAERSLEAALKAESSLIKELRALEEESAAINIELLALDEQCQQLSQDERQFWQSRNAFALGLGDFQNDRDMLNVKYDHDSRQLERLQRTNVYNDMFCIGHDGYFGTINGLRLGRLNNPPVEWPEINSAWGQTVLLLAVIADKLQFQFEGYKLHPLGSTSRIEKTEVDRSSNATAHNSTGSNVRTTSQKVAMLDLFFSGDIPLHLPWLYQRFNAGMVAFLECLHQLGAHVERPGLITNQSPSSATLQCMNCNSQKQCGHIPTNHIGLKLPYDIKRDKIGDSSIKLGFNQNDETWTRACKYTLTCCKFLLAHVSNISTAKVDNTTAS